MKYSIVIPVYNGINFLKINLPELLDLNPDEVIIVDDASSDGSLSFVESNFPSIKLVKHKINTRFPKAANDGVVAASNEIVILLNQDVLMKNSFTKRLDKHFSNPKMFAVTFNERNRSWAKAKLKNGFIEFANGVLDENTHSSFWANGGSAAFRKNIWVELGGFDESFSPGYYEDFDLGWRARNKGYEIVWDPEIVVEHAHPESTFSKNFNTRQLVRLKERNYLLSHWKNLRLNDLLVNILFALKRVVQNPGYIIPVCMALVKIPEIVKFRLIKYAKN